MYKTSFITYKPEDSRTMKSMLSPSSLISSKKVRKHKKECRKKARFPD